MTLKYFMSLFFNVFCTHSSGKNNSNVRVYGFHVCGEGVKRYRKYSWHYCQSPWISHKLRLVPGRKSILCALSRYIGYLMSVVYFRPKCSQSSRQQNCYGYRLRYASEQKGKRIVLCWVPRGLWCVMGVNLKHRLFSF